MNESDRAGTQGLSQLPNVDADDKRTVPAVQIIRPARMRGEGKAEYMARCNIDRTPADYARIEKAAQKRARRRHAHVTERIVGRYPKLPTRRLFVASAEPLAAMDAAVDDLRAWKREALARAGEDPNVSRPDPSDPLEASVTLPSAGYIFHWKRGPNVLAISGSVARTLKHFLRPVSRRRQRLNQRRSERAQTCALLEAMSPKHVNGTA